MTRKKGYKLIIFSVMIATIFLILGNYNKVYAASASISISSGTATQGEEINVTVTISADSSIGAYDFYLEYDANILEAVSGFDGGGGGRIQLTDYAQDTSEVKSLTVTVKFKAIATGTSAIKYVAINEDNGVIDFATVENMSVSASNGQVTVSAPVVASTNNNLSSMTVAAVKADGTSYNVALTPGFSKDVTTYDLQVEEGVTKLVISAKAEDSKASVATQWTALDPGDNTTKVIVTAENGSTKQYVIRTKVATTQETTTTEPEKEPVTVVIDGVNCYVENINDAVELPEGFETFEYDYDGNTIIAAKGLTKDLVVMYITYGDGSAGRLHVYDEESGAFYPMVNVQMTQKLYTIVNEPEDLQIPSGFKECEVVVEDNSFKGWKNDSIEGVYLVYAMNWDGESGLYYYDEKEKQMLRYFESTVETDVEANVDADSYNNILAENEELKKELEEKQNTEADVDDSGNAKNDIYKYIAYGCGAASIILLILVIILLIKRKKNNKAATTATTDTTDTVTAVEEVEETIENPTDETGETEEETVEAAAEEICETVKEDIENTTEQASEVVEEATEEATEQASEVVEEAVEEATEQASEVVEETAENITEETNISSIDNTISQLIEREMAEKKAKEQSPEDIEKKMKVADILNDEETSIPKRDIDMVIDELFDDLFDE